MFTLLAIGLVVLLLIAASLSESGNTGNQGMTITVNPAPAQSSGAVEVLLIIFTLAGAVGLVHLLGG